MEEQLGPGHLRPVDREEVWTTPGISKLQI